MKKGYRREQDWREKEGKENKSHKFCQVEVLYFTPIFP